MKQKCMNLRLTLWRWGTAVLLGALVGAVGALFVRALGFAVRFRTAHAFMPYLLPAAGLVIVTLYRLCRYKDEGTDLILCAARNEKKIPAAAAPLILVSAVLTQFVGGSAGREGAALQFGGGLSAMMGRLIGVKSEAHLRLFVLCGMSAGFSAVFGTPIAAALFTLEIACVGMIAYADLFPCTLASLSAYMVSGLCGAEREAYSISALSSLTVLNLGKVLVLALLCGAAARFFCTLLAKGGKWVNDRLPNPYVRVLIASAALIAVFALESSGDFCGTGSVLIEKALRGETKIYSFLLKMLVTFLTLKGGFKGGEIVPSFAIGACLGCLAGPVLGLEPSMCAALCMIAFFASVTNCPITALILSFEMFGGQCAVFFLLSIAAAHLISGSCGLYHTQKIYFSVRNFSLEPHEEAVKNG